ncbi:HEAT repeat domain-containing protein [Streptomyces sp. NPDC058369]|uniref:HEAT repeat domain-containing protein n=1 Tax=unclassified Streptomyces TaxID=2593676 RepID=UPI00224F1842|nr:HEAT repeat domain-containing protein [Streptomyces sp. NBC_01789]MCX4445353.1 HEAT repeat domain-containing protein [Streptomyces sp. NBC_01789]
MDQTALIAELELATKQKESTSGIVRRLAEPGAAAAPGLVAALGTVSRPALWGLRDALRLIGPAAFDAAVAARARAAKVPEWWELGHVLRGFDERCIPGYTAALSHPMKEIRQQALWGLQNLGEAAAGTVPEVIPFLNDADSYTRYQAENTVRAIGAEAAPLLRAIRRDGPSSLRRHALTALALIGGADSMGERDRRALERLIRVKTAQDTPDPLPDHWWLAVPGATYEGLFEAMGLHDRIPCTLSMGLSAMGADATEITDPDGTRHTAYRVFVTPELDGWRLIYADTPLRQMTWSPTDLINRLSAACGQAQFFYQDDHSDSMVWAVAVDGVPRRRYWRYSDPEWEGEPMEWETPLSADPDYDPEEGEEDDDPNATTETDTTGAASSLSIDPTAVGSRTALRGHGWLAITRPDTGHGAFRGALRI